MVSVYRKALFSGLCIGNGDLKHCIVFIAYIHSGTAYIAVGICSLRGLEQAEVKRKGYLFIAILRNRLYSKNFRWSFLRLFYIKHDLCAGPAYGCCFLFRSNNIRQPVHRCRRRSVFDDHERWDLTLGYHKACCHSFTVFNGQHLCLGKFRPVRSSYDYIVISVRELLKCRLRGPGSCSSFRWSYYYISSLNCDSIRHLRIIFSRYIYLDLSLRYRCFLYFYPEAQGLALYFPAAIDLYGWIEGIDFIGLKVSIIRRIRPVCPHDPIYPGPGLSVFADIEADLIIVLKSGCKSVQGHTLCCDVCRRLAVCLGFVIAGQRSVDVFDLIFCWRQAWSTYWVWPNRWLIIIVRLVADRSFKDLFVIPSDKAFAGIANVRRQIISLLNRHVIDLDRQRNLSRRKSYRTADPDVSIGNYIVIDLLCAAIRMEGCRYVSPSKVYGLSQNRIVIVFPRAVINGRTLRRVLCKCYLDAISCSVIGIGKAGILFSFWIHSCKAHAEFGNVIGCSLYRYLIIKRIRFAFRHAVFLAVQLHSTYGYGIIALSGRRWCRGFKYRLNLVALRDHSFNRVGKRLQRRVLASELLIGSYCKFSFPDLKFYRITLKPFIAVGLCNLCPHVICSRIDGLFWWIITVRRLSILEFGSPVFALSIWLRRLFTISPVVDRRRVYEWIVASHDLPLMLRSFRIKSVIWCRISWKQSDLCFVRSDLFCLIIGISDLKHILRPCYVVDFSSDLLFLSIIEEGILWPGEGEDLGKNGQLSFVKYEMIICCIGNSDRNIIFSLIFILLIIIGNRRWKT